jgi:hypothetical protein
VLLLIWRFGVAAVGLQFNAALICSEPEGGGAGSALALQLCRHYACVDLSGPGLTHAQVLAALRASAYVVTVVSPRLLCDPWCLHLVDFVERTRGTTTFEQAPPRGRGSQGCLCVRHRYVYFSSSSR